MKPFLFAIAALASAQDIRFHHIHLNAEDPARAARFYTERFNATLDAPNNAVQLGDGKLLLFQKAPAPIKQKPPTAFWHFGWGAPDMKAEYTRQIALGTVFDTPLTDISDIFGRTAPEPFLYAYVAGPDGALIELNTARSNKFGHIHLFSRDPLAAAAFYEKHLGWRVASKNPNKVLYRGFQIGPTASLAKDAINLIIFPAEYLAPNLDFVSTKGRTVDHIAFSVPDLKAFAQSLKSAGLSLTAESPAAIELEAPDKILIEILQQETQK
jgi:catechol 2,3-dioxygenase-like lactoylglutathione lyase family enzyme